MRLLDHARPYAEIHGLPGAVYEQDGIRFKTDGTEALDTSPIIEEIWVSEKEENPPSVSCVEQLSLPPEATSKSLEDMHWKALKVLVESYGGEWTNRQDAIQFIRGK